MMYDEEIKWNRVLPVPFDLFINDYFSPIFFLQVFYFPNTIFPKYSGLWKSGFSVPTGFQDR